MSKEKELIETINKYMPKSSQQLNNLFESDAEIVDFKGPRLVYNIDDFSEEDVLRDEEPYILGWNIAVGSISDILASGGRPKFYAHSLVIKSAWTPEYVAKLSQGISDVLKQSGVSFIGGDLGVSERWRYTGSVIGELEGSPMLRSGAKIGDAVFISGKIGMGNIEAAFKLYSENPLVKNVIQRFKNRFSLRSREALLIKEYSNCCIDTSDGVFNALKMISEMSETGFEIDSLPYEKTGILLAKLLNMPKELLFLGECGEYELLFTIKKELCADFYKRAHEMNLTFYKIGEIKEQGIKQLHGVAKKIDLSSYDLSARDYRDIKIYLRDVLDFVEPRRLK